VFSAWALRAKPTVVNTREAARNFTIRPKPPAEDDSMRDSSAITQEFDDSKTYF
jgi:hypothetical protein